MKRGRYIMPRAPYPRRSHGQKCPCRWCRRYYTAIKPRETSQEADDADEEDSP